MAKITKSIEEINEKIEQGEAVVVTAEEMTQIVKKNGEEKVAKEVDVVTTGSFGAMCSSGAWLNFGHADPPIKMQQVWLNDVEAYTGVAAVDAYIGAAQLSESKGLEYGGGHVIEDLVRGEEIEVKAKGYGTDCYPRRKIETIVTKQDLNQAVLCNPRNVHQKYHAASNSSDETISTYMGKLLPNFRNVTFSGSGALNPLSNDPNYDTIGPGTKIFLGGAQGMIFWEGTQHDPTNEMGTLMVVGDLKEMDSRYLRGASIEGYGVSLYVGIGLPIPIINEKVAKATGISDEEIWTKILDYGAPHRDRPVLKEVNYADLKSGEVELKGAKRPVSPLSSIKRSREIAEVLKDWIEKKDFKLSQPTLRLSKKRKFMPMKRAPPVPLVKDLMIKDVITANPDEPISEASRIFAEKGFDHLPVVNENEELVGIVTSWDIAVGQGKEKLSEILTRKVITAKENQPVASVARKLEKHRISGVPVIDSDRKLKGILTSEDISKLIGRQE